MGGQGAPRDLLQHKIGLFLDVDGTLLDLAPTPAEVEMPAGLRETLAAAERRLGGALALVSGRPIWELDRLFAPLELASSGTHGAEIRTTAGVPSTWLTGGWLPEQAWQELLRLLEGFPDVFAENKGVGFTVHYRDRGRSKEELAAALEGLIEELAGFELELRAGYRVFEIQPRQCDKGRAIELFMTRPPFAGKRPVFVADDPLDRPGFDMVLAQGGLAFSVGAALPGLSGWFQRPSAVRAWLAEMTG